MSRTSVRNLSGVSETLLLPLYFRAVESQRPDAIFRDTRAVELVGNIDYDFARLRTQTFTQVLTAMRVREFDRVARAFLAGSPGGVVVDIGCGLDSRIERIDDGACDWYGIDLPEVISLRRRLLAEPPRSHPIACSALDPGWIEEIAGRESKPVLLLAEGVLPYLEETDVKRLVLLLRSRFEGSELVFDALPPLQVRLGRLHPVLRKTRAALHWGLARDDELESWAPGLRLVGCWRYFDRPVPRIGPLRLLRFLPPLAKGYRVLRYRLGT